MQFFNAFVDLYIEGVIPDNFSNLEDHSWRIIQAHNFYENKYFFKFICDVVDEWFVACSSNFRR